MELQLIHGRRVQTCFQCTSNGAVVVVCFPNIRRDEEKPDVLIVEIQITICYIVV